MRRLLMKRTRVDGQISREEYETTEFESGSSTNFFSKATPNTLATRRIMFGRRQDKKHEFIRYIKALNSSIRDWFVGEVKKNGICDLRDGAQLISFKIAAHHIKIGRGDRVDSWVCAGSACTAGAFATAPVVPIVTTVPGVKVVSIACGSNHNLAVTSDNSVYSWGYGDMLALGHGEERDELAPKKLNFSKARIDNISVTQVSGGGQHSAIAGVVLGTQ